MLKVCKETHEEVVYSTPVCPACMIIAHFTERIQQMEEVAEAYQERIEILESDLKETINA